MHEINIDKAIPLPPLTSVHRVSITFDSLARRSSGPGKGEVEDKEVVIDVKDVPVDPGPLNEITGPVNATDAMFRMKIGE